MAIQLQNFTDKFGATHSEAYAKVTELIYSNISGDKSATFALSIYASKQTSDDGFPPLATLPRFKVACIDVAGAYQHLMTLDEYKDGVSV